MAQGGSAWELLGGSWVVISRVVSRITMVITYIRGLMTPLITTHEPPSRLPPVELTGFQVPSGSRLMSMNSWLAMTL